MKIRYIPELLVVLYFMISLTGNLGIDISSIIPTTQKTTTEAKFSLINEYDSVILNKNLLNDLPVNICKNYNKVFVADTLLIGTSNFNNNYYLKVKLYNSGDVKVFAQLKCSKEVFEKAIVQNLRKAVVALKITGYQENFYTNEILDLSENIIQSGLTKDISIDGECLDYIQVLD